MCEQNWEEKKQGTLQRSHFLSYENRTGSKKNRVSVNRSRVCLDQFLSKKKKKKHGLSEQIMGLSRSVSIN